MWIRDHLTIKSENEGSKSPEQGMFTFLFENPPRWWKSTRMMQGTATKQNSGIQNLKGVLSQEIAGDHENNIQQSVELLLREYHTYPVLHPWNGTPLDPVGSETKSCNRPQHKCIWNPETISHTVIHCRTLPKSYHSGAQLQRRAGHRDSSGSCRSSTQSDHPSDCNNFFAQNSQGSRILCPRPGTVSAHPSHRSRQRALQSIHSPGWRTPHRESLVFLRRADLADDKQLSLLKWRSLSLSIYPLTSTSNLQLGKHILYRAYTLVCEEAREGIDDELLESTQRTRISIKQTMSIRL